VAVAARHQRLEYLLGRQADLARNGFRAQVVGIDRVRAQFVGDPHLFQKPHRVGLHAVARGRERSTRSAHILLRVTVVSRSLAT
jgi:hypothetical protein